MGLFGATGAPLAHLRGIPRAPVSLPEGYIKDFPSVLCAHLPSVLVNTLLRLAEIP